jgi:tetratricopeptide (TPR) repeat protein
MSVSPSKGIYKCFSCGAGGDALNFLVKIQNREYKDVIFELADKFGFELPKKYNTNNENKNIKKDMLKACKMAADFYHEYLFTSDAKVGINLLSKRDITDGIINTYNLGFAPNKYDTLYNLGLAYHIAQRYNDAGLLYCKAIQVKPMNYEAHYNLGVLLRRMRKYQDSYNELEKAATLITALDEDDVQIQYVALILNDIMHQMYSNESYQKQLQREKIEEEMIRQARAKKWHFNFRFGKKENYDNYDQEYWYEEDSENNKKKIKSTLGEGIKIIDGKITATEDLDKAVTEEFSKCPSIKYFKGVYD